MTRPGARTLYELVAEKGDRRVLIAYTSRRGRRMLWDCAREHAGRLVALTGAVSLVFAKPARAGALMGDWKIRWTGRTEREAAGSTLPWIGEQ